MTDETDVAELRLTGNQLADLMGLSATFTLIEDAVQDLDMFPLADEDVAVLLLMPDNFRLKLTARLVELADVAREAVQELDGRVLQLTNGEPV